MIRFLFFFFSDSFFVSNAVLSYILSILSFLSRRINEKKWSSFIYYQEVHYLSLHVHFCALILLWSHRPMHFLPISYLQQKPVPELVTIFRIVLAFLYFTGNKCSLNSFFRSLDNSFFRSYVASCRCIPVWVGLYSINCRSDKW